MGVSSAQGQAPPGQLCPYSLMVACQTNKSCPSPVGPALHDVGGSFCRSCGMHVHMIYTASGATGAHESIQRQPHAEKLRSPRKEPCTPQLTASSLRIRLLQARHEECRHFR